MIWSRVAGRSYALTVPFLARNPVHLFRVMPTVNHDTVNHQYLIYRTRLVSSSIFTALGRELGLLEVVYGHDVGTVEAFRWSPGERSGDAAIDGGVRVRKTSDPNTG